MPFDGPGIGRLEEEEVAFPSDPSSEEIRRRQPVDGFGADVVSVPPDTGQVHHYRQCLASFDVTMDCSPATFVDDDGLRRTGHIPALRTRVRRVLDEFLPPRNR